MLENTFESMVIFTHYSKENKAMKEKAEDFRRSNLLTKAM